MPILRLPEVQVVAEVRFLEWLAVGSAHVARHHEQVRRVLGELLVALHVQGVRERVPYGLVDPDDMVLAATRKTVEVETVARSMGPESGIEILGWMLNPSSVFRTSTSAQSDG